MPIVPNDEPVSIVANPDAPVIFADGAVGAFVNNGNVHITLVTRKSDYGRQTNALADVITARLVMPLSASEQMVRFLSDCLETLKRQSVIGTDDRRLLQ